MAKVHIMVNSIYSYNFIKEVNSKYSLKDHKFIIFDVGETGSKIDPEITKYENVTIHDYIPVNMNANRFNNKILKTLMLFTKHILSTIKILHDIVPSLYSADKIIMHGYFLEYFTYLFSVNPWLLRKTSWAIWGGDLYNYTYINNFYGRFQKRLHYHVLKHMSRYLGMGVDISTAQKEFKSHTILQETIYSQGVGTSYLDKYDKNTNLYGSTLNDPNVVHKKVIIQLGNSAAYSNLHAEALQALSKFKDENIEIHCLLTYGGTQDYIDGVIKIGKEIFGSKFIPMLEWLDKDDMTKHMLSVDIFIGYHNRQQALSNFLSYMYLKKKVFMKSNINFWDYLTNGFRLDLYDSLTIQDLTFDELIYQSQEKKDDCHEKVSKTFCSQEYTSNTWYYALK